MDVFHTSIAAGTGVTRETHPYSETLVVLDGEVACTIEDGETVVLRRGDVWHVVADRCHEVRNIGPSSAELSMLIGV